LANLRERSAAPDLWSDPAAARTLTQQLARTEQTVATSDRLTRRLDDAGVLLDLAQSEGDSTTLVEVDKDLAGLETELGGLERVTLFFGEYDAGNAIVSVHAGAGGVDAQDWAEILLRMYLRFLERTDWAVELDEVQPGEEAGIKSATFTVRGDYAYGSMESERGVHRLVRISPFDSAARRHTSFAAVDVIPEVADEEVEIDEEDLRIDTFRSQGAGGQHVNKTDSAVRLTHLPTNTVVACQAERSQLQNKNRAMELLRARLGELARRERQAKLDSIRGSVTEAAWGRQIRSYVLQPYQLVKDLRTNLEVGNVSGVLGGDLQPLIDSYLAHRRASRPE